jgi:glycosyltransferase involved in cell wall biosynthesis
VRRLRVLHVITRLVVGGAQENTLATVAGLRACGHEVVLATGPSEGSEGSLMELARRSGIPPLLVPGLVREVSPMRDATALVHLYRLIRRGRFDVVHTHTSKAGVLGRVAARMAGIQVIVHTPHGHVFDGYFGPLATATFVAVERACARFTDAMVAISEECRHDHLERGIGTPERFLTIPSGIPRATAGDRASARRLLGAADGDLLVGCVGRLVPVKGQDVLLAAFEHVADRHGGVRLVLVGDGPSRLELERQARRLGVSENVSFLGLRTDAHRLFVGFDVYVQPSLNDGMCRAVAHALDAGIPVVASDVPGPAELLGPGGSGGIIVPAGDAAALAGTLDRVLADEDLRARLGEAARDRSASLVREDEMVAAIERLYLALLSQRRPLRQEVGTRLNKPAIPTDAFSRNAHPL